MINKNFNIFSHDFKNRELFYRNAMQARYMLSSCGCLSVCPSVCLSICPSQAGTVQKRLNVVSRK